MKEATSKRGPPQASTKNKSSCVCAAEHTHTPQPLLASLYLYRFVKIHILAGLLMLTSERKCSFENKNVQHWGAFLCGRTRRRVFKPRLRLFSAAHSPPQHPPCQPVSFICCHAELQMVPVFCSTVHTCCFHGFLESTLIWLVVLACYISPF